MKNIEHVNRIVSSEKNINIDIVKKINKFYWKEVRKNIVNFSSVGVLVHEIGTFAVSRHNLRIEIHETITKIKRIKTSKRFSPHFKEKMLNSYYSILRKMLIKRNELAILYNETYYKKWESSKNI